MPTLDGGGAPSLATFNLHLDGARSNLIYLKTPLILDGALQGNTLKVPPRPKPFRRSTKERHGTGPFPQADFAYSPHLGHFSTPALSLPCLKTPCSTNWSRATRARSSHGPPTSACLPPSRHLATPNHRPRASTPSTAPTNTTLPDKTLAPSPPPPCHRHTRRSPPPKAFAKHRPAPLPQPQRGPCCWKPPQNLSDCNLHLLLPPLQLRNYISPLTSTSSGLPGTPPPGAQGLGPAQTQDPSLTAAHFLPCSPATPRKQADKTQQEPCYRATRVAPQTGTPQRQQRRQREQRSQTLPFFPLSFLLKLFLLPSFPILSSLHTGAGAAPSRNTPKAQGPTPRATHAHATTTTTARRPSLHHGAPQPLTSDITSQPCPTRKEKTSEDENKGEAQAKGKPTTANTRALQAEKTRGQEGKLQPHKRGTTACPAGNRETLTHLPGTAARTGSAPALSHPPPNHYSQPPPNTPPPPPPPRTATPPTHFPKTTTATSQN